MSTENPSSLASIARRLESTSSAGTDHELNTLIWWHLYCPERGKDDAMRVDPMGTTLERARWARCFFGTHRATNWTGSLDATLDLVQDKLPKSFDRDYFLMEAFRDTQCADTFDYSQPVSTQLAWRTLSLLMRRISEERGASNATPERTKVVSQAPGQDRVEPSNPSNLAAGGEP